MARRQVVPVTVHRICGHNTAGALIAREVDQPVAPVPVLDGLVTATPATEAYAIVAAPR